MLDLILFEETVLHYNSYIARETVHSASYITFNKLDALLTHFITGWYS